jgi:hypothetical protein
MRITAVRSLVVLGPRRTVDGRVYQSALGGNPVSEHGLGFIETDGGISRLGEISSVFTRRGKLLCRERSISCSDPPCWARIPSAPRNWCGSRSGSRVGKQRVHACGIEASAGLALAPEIVRGDRLAEAKGRAYPHRHTRPKEVWSVEWLYRWDELTANGALGDASRATASLGAELCQAALDRPGVSVEDLMARRRRRAWLTTGTPARTRRTHP